MSMHLDDGAVLVAETITPHEPSDADWRKLAEMLAPYYQGGLFTLLQVDRRRALVRRAYSSNPVDYAPGGTKQLMGTSWARRVIDEGRCFIASTREQMESAFADHQILSALGFTTALNIPLRQGIDVAWTVNLLRGEPVFTPEESAVVKSCIKEWIGNLCPDSRPARRA